MRNDMKKWRGSLFYVRGVRHGVLRAKYEISVGVVFANPEVCSDLFHTQSAKKLAHRRV